MTTTLTTTKTTKTKAAQTKTMALLGVILAAGMPAMALAQSALDMNGDGMVSLDEVQATFPDVDSDAFMAADADGDALLNPDELLAAQEAGIIPATEG